MFVLFVKRINKDLEHDYYIEMSTSNIRRFQKAIKISLDCL